MDQLIAELKNLAAHHASSPNADFYALLGGLGLIVEAAEVSPIEYQYRHHLEWDTTWIDLDESQIAHVLTKGHAVERRSGAATRGLSPFFLEMTNDAIGDLIDRWKTNGMVGEFPDALAVQDELKRSICLEDKQVAETAGRPEATP